MRKEAGDILLLGGGDFSDRSTELGKYRTRVALEAMTMMKYDAITIGERELSMGHGFLSENIDVEKLPVVTTNLYHNGERFGEPYLIFEKNGIKIGVVSALMKVGSRQSVVWEIRDHSAELREVIPELEDKCDLIVVLSHLGFTKSFDLPDEFPQIDVVISAHGSRKTTEPTRVGSAVLTKGGNQGKWLGRLDLELVPEGGVGSFEGSLINLGPKLPEDPVMAEFFNAYKDSAAKLQPILTKQRSGEQVDLSGGSDFKGSRWCRSCHVKEFNSWMKTSHSKAFNHLRNEKKINDEDCLSCHTTGYGEGGFTNLDETPVLANVQCEACHGSGKNHIQSKGNTKTEAVVVQTCTHCHDEEWDPDFDFAVKKALVH